jgi:beta-phosphoglucomutase
MDGVLIHSAEIHRKAFEEAFKPFGINDFDYSMYAGQRTPEVVLDVLARRGLSSAPEVVAKTAIEKSSLAKQMMDADYPIDEAYGVILSRLAAQFDLALASSGSRGSVENFLRYSGARSLFRSVLSGDDVEQAKPDPEIYRRSMERLGLDPKECLVVEDAVSGVEAAKAAGSPVIALMGTIGVQELREAGADRIIGRLGDLVNLLPADRPVDRPQWTAIIPAAGRGSRLGFNRPKILYPVAGRMILEWMLDFLEPCYGNLVFVLSPEGRDDVAGELHKLIPGRFEVVIQHTPTGMGDAVELALPHVNTPHVSVIWGDQVTLQRSSVEGCQKLHEGPLQPDLTCPTVLRAKPYIHFDRNTSGEISGLRQAREGDQMPPHGESDTGFFCFKTARLRELLKTIRSSSHSSGNRTGEFNLLPVIPVAAREGVVLTPRLMRIEETQGINASEDAIAVAEFLRRSDGR